MTSNSIRCELICSEVKINEPKTMKLSSFDFGLPTCDFRLPTFPYILLIILTVQVLSTTGCAQKLKPEQDWQVLKEELIQQLLRQGIDDPNVIKALRAVPRHAFVPEDLRRESYDNNPLPIGHRQTISQPFVVAYMCQELHLKATDRVLEIGTGSGYHAAVMSELAAEIYTIEIIPELAEDARQVLDSLGYQNIHVRVGDGFQGWLEHAPYDAIILTAAPSSIPEALKDQLKLGGRLIAPVGTDWQQLILLERTDQGLKSTKLLPVRFVPMTGQAEN